MKPKKTGYRFWMALVVFSLAGQVAWTVENMYFNVFLYKMFHASPREISLMVGASAVSATVTTLLIGALSDKLGRRKIFICGGYLLWGVTIWCFSLIRMEVLERVAGVASAAALGIFLTIFMDCIMTFFGSAANDACFNAWLTDATEESSRGKIEGINAAMPLVSILVVFGGFLGFDLDRGQSWVSIFRIIGSCVMVIGLLGLFLIQEGPVSIGENQSYFGNILYGFRPGAVRQNPKLYGTLLSVALFNSSVNVFMPYLILYYTVSLKMDNYVFIFAPAVVLAAIFTFLYGRAYDRRPFRQAVMLPWILLVQGYVGLYFCRSTGTVFAYSLSMMCGYLGMGAMLGAKVRTHTPENKAGMFQGLRIFTQVLIPGIVGPAIGAAVLRNAATILNDDGTTSFVPNENIFLAALAVALVFWLGLRQLFAEKEEDNGTR